MLKKAYASFKNNLILKILGNQVSAKNDKKMVARYFTTWLILAGNSIKMNNNLQSSPSVESSDKKDLNQDFEQFQERINSEPFIEGSFEEEFKDINE